MTIFGAYTGRARAGRLGRRKALVKAAAAPPPPAGAAAADPWVQVKDEASGQFYWYGGRK